MRKPATRKTDEDELRPEYDAEFFRSMKPNRFASRPKLGRVQSVVLDPDVAEVFRSSEEVNEFLRSAIATMPPRTAKARKKRGS